MEWEPASQCKTQRKVVPLTNAHIEATPTAVVTTTHVPLMHTLPVTSHGVEDETHSAGEDGPLPWVEQPSWGSAKL